MTSTSSLPASKRAAPAPVSCSTEAAVMFVYQVSLRLGCMNYIYIYSFG